MNDSIEARLKHVENNSGCIATFTILLVAFIISGLVTLTIMQGRICAIEAKIGIDHSKQPEHWWKVDQFVCVGEPKK